MGHFACPEGVYLTATELNSTLTETSGYKEWLQVPEGSRPLVPTALLHQRANATHDALGLRKARGARPLSQALRRAEGTDFTW